MGGAGIKKYAYQALSEVKSLTSELIGLGSHNRITVRRLRLRNSRSITHPHHKQTQYN